MLFNVAVLKQSTTRETVPSDEVFFHRRVRAGNRIEALEKCLPDLRAKVLPRTDPSIRFISVFVGRKGSVTGAACRLTPLQIDCRTGERRCQAVR